MDEILIIGNVVSLRSVCETKKISTEESYQSLSQCVGMMTPFLPPAVIFYGARENISVYVTHHQPQMRNVKVKYSDDNEEEFEIKLPHLYFFHKYQYSAFDDLFVFGAKEQVYSVADNLFRVPLKNLYVDGRVCLGDDLKFNQEGRISGKEYLYNTFLMNCAGVAKRLCSGFPSQPRRFDSGRPLQFYIFFVNKQLVDSCD